MQPIEELSAARHVVVQDYPSPEVPDSLVRAGLQVTVYGGPDESDVSVRELRDDEVVSRRTGRRPESADLLYVYRPVAELQPIVADALRMGVRTLWRHPQADEAAGESKAWRDAVESAGLRYLDSADVVEVARALQSAR